MIEVLKLRRGLTGREKTAERTEGIEIKQMVIMNIPGLFLVIKERAYPMMMRSLQQSLFFERLSPQRRMPNQSEMGWRQTTFL